MIVVVGGAGYIGSHICRELARQGREHVVFDNLSNGHRAAVRGIPVFEGDILELTTIREALVQAGASAVIHLAAQIEVGRSVADPATTFRTNVIGTLNLLEAMRDAGVQQLVFSSTAAVYGEPQTPTLSEEHPLAPVNPYGASKLTAEMMIQAFAQAHGLRSYRLRYFNAAGADPSGEIGEDHDPETHLIPLVLRRALGDALPLAIFGEDYDTPDGTAIRDYVHVQDIAAAHVLALDRLAAGASGGVFNLGTGAGASVREVVAAAERVTGCEVPTVSQPRRAGDPARLVADARRAHQELNWAPKRSDLETIIEDAWRWHAGHPSGYED